MNIFRPETKVKVDQLVTTGTPSSNSFLAGDGSYQEITIEPFDVVGGRLDYVDTTHLKWGFQNSNQIRLVNPDTGRWELVKAATEPTIANTALDLNGTALVPNTIYDVFAEYDSSTAFNLVLSRWATGGDGANNSSTSYATPVMTANNAPGPVVVSADSEYSATFAAWKAFDQSDGAQDEAGPWASSAAPTAQAPQTLMVDFGQPVCINKYILKSRYAASQNIESFPKTWTFEATNGAGVYSDASGTNGWTVLDQVATSTDPGYNAWEAAYHTFKNSQSYQKYRIVITDRYGTSAWVAINELKLVAAANSLAGGSSRVRAYESTVTYAIGDRVTYDGHDWVKQSSAAAGTTPVAGNDWVDNGTSVSGDFAGLYRHDGVLVSDSSDAGKSRRWLGIIYTYNNSGTVNFKDDVNYRFVSNFYNKKPVHVVSYSPTASFTGPAGGAVVEVDSCVRGNFITSATQNLYGESATYTYYSAGNGCIYSGIGIDSTSSCLGVKPFMYVAGSGVGDTYFPSIGLAAELLTGAGFHFMSHTLQGGSLTQRTVYGGNSSSYRAILRFQY